VSCSVVRRVALPDAFFTMDGLLETALTVLGDFGAFRAVIDDELQRYLPFLMTTKVLMAAVRKGAGREAAHEAIRAKAVAAALAMRETGGANTLLDLLADDPVLHLSRVELDAIVTEPMSLTGAATSQVAAVAARVQRVIDAAPQDAAYRPGAIL